MPSKIVATLGSYALALTLLGVVASPSAVAGKVYHSDRLLIVPKAGRERALERLHARENVRVRRAYPHLGHICVLQLPAGARAAQVLDRYQRSGLVECAELDGTLRAAASPNDPYFQNTAQWGLHNLGTQPGFAADADIDAPEGWDFQRTATNVVVAVIDSGARLTHEDLADNLWINPDEIPDNGVDDDHNGYIDDVHGINAITPTVPPNDDYNHGSHVTGILGAVGNNGLGVSGVLWRARIMICRFLDSDGNGAFSDVVECIDYARNHGAKILNASFVTDVKSMLLFQALDRCREAGIIVVAAAGNSGDDNDLMPLYPASYNLSNLVAVTATDSLDRLWVDSNFGATNVHLAAPGVSIFSTGRRADDDYFYNTGTSMAAPFVSGAMALVWSRFPADPYWKVIHRVLVATDRLPALAGKCSTGGRLNLRNALDTRPALLVARSALVTRCEVRLRGVPDQAYVLQSSVDLRTWTPVATNTTGSDGWLSFYATNAAPPVQALFRAVEAP